MTSSSPLSSSSTLRLSSGYDMPVLGFGVYQIDKAIAPCLAALKEGYRQIDSAKYYDNEGQVGEAVRQSGIPREEVFITSKIYHTHFSDPTAAFSESLNELGFDYFDLYLVHSPLSGKDLRLSAYKTLLDEKKAGRVKSVGVSNYGIKHLKEIEEAGLEAPCVNQIELHPWCQQREIVEYCKAQNPPIIIQAYCPVNRGMLDGPPWGETPLIGELAEKYKRTKSQILIRWSLQKGYSPLPKSERPERIAENANVFDFEISKEDIDKLDELDMDVAGATQWNPVDAE